MSRYIHRAPAKRIIIPGVTGALDWPGLPGGNNPVGFAAAPGWPGGFRNSTFFGSDAPVTLNQYAGFLGGSIPDGTVINYIDFIGMNAGTQATFLTNTGLTSGGVVNNMTFHGCRFQNNALAAGGQVALDTNLGGTGTVFSYCTMTPMVTSGFLISGNTWAAPPTGPVSNWPASTAGTGNTMFSGGSAYVIPYNDGWGQYGIQAANTTFDHCDIWGAGNICASVTGPTTNIVKYSDCWVHDARFGAPDAWAAGVLYTAFRNVVRVSGDTTHQYFCQVTHTSIAGTSGAAGSQPPNADWAVSVTGGAGSDVDHTDYCGFFGGGSNAPANQSFTHCVIAGLGSTDIIGLQECPNNYQNWTFRNCYLSGANVVFEAGGRATLTPPLVNCIFQDNVFATDVAHTNAFVTSTANTVWQANGNVWKNNKLRVYPGDSWSGYSSTQNGNFVYPDNTDHAGVDFS